MIIEVPMEETEKNYKKRTRNGREKQWNFVRSEFLTLKGKRGDFN